MGLFFWRGFRILTGLAIQLAAIAVFLTFVSQFLGDPAGDWRPGSFDIIGVAALVLGLFGQIALGLVIIGLSEVDRKRRVVFGIVLRLLALLFFLGAGVFFTLTYFSVPYNSPNWEGDPLGYFAPYLTGLSYCFTAAAGYQQISARFLSPSDESYDPDAPPPRKAIELIFH